MQLKLLYVCDLSVQLIILIRRYCAYVISLNTVLNASGVQEDKQTLNVHTSRDFGYFVFRVLRISKQDDRKQKGPSLLKSSPSDEAQTDIIPQQERDAEEAQVQAGAQLFSTIQK